MHRAMSPPAVIPEFSLDHDYIQRTDPQRWRLTVKEGRQLWHYLATESESNAHPQADYEKYWLGLPLVTLLTLT